MVIQCNLVKISKISLYLWYPFLFCVVTLPMDSPTEHHYLMSYGKSRWSDAKMEKNKKCTLNSLDHRGLLEKAQVISGMDKVSVTAAATDISQTLLWKLVSLLQFLQLWLLFRLTMICSYGKLWTTADHLSFSFAWQMERQDNFSLAKQILKSFSVRCYTSEAFSTSK